MDPNVNFNTTQKSSKGLIILVVVFAILAAGGIGFGIYGMTQNNKKAIEPEKVSVEMKNADGTTTQVTAQKVEETNNGTTTVTIEPVKEGVNTEEYVYLSSWGVKIHVGKNLKIAAIHEYDGQSFQITTAYDSEYGKVKGYPFSMTIIRGTDRESITGPTTVKTVEYNGYFYAINGQSGVGIVEGLTNEQMSALENANKDLSGVLQDATNYSVI